MGKKEKTLSNPKQKKGQIIRVATGVPFFDSLVQGGFEKNSVNLLVGGPGTGKSIFSTQYLLEGLKKGEQCLYITFEEKKDQFYTNMYEFGIDLEELEKKGLFTFLEYSPIKVKTMLDEGGGTIESVIKSKKITRIVIDSITSFELLFDSELEKREAALSLFSLIRGWNCTSILTLEEEPFENGQVSSKALEFESDSIILLYFTRQKNERIKCLEIIKMRGTNHSNKIYRYEISKTGIKVDKKPFTLIRK